MNEKGQMVLFGLMVMVFLLVVTIILINPLKEIIQENRIAMNCSNQQGLNLNERAICLVMDMYLPYFIITLLIGSAAYLFYRLVTE